jgi:transketolase N-terminal domain/subunit
MDFDAAWVLIQRNLDKVVSMVDAEGPNRDGNTEEFTSTDYMNTYG